MGPDTRTQVAHGAAAAQPTSHMGPHQRSQRRTWGHISAVNVAYGATSAQSASHSSVDDALGVRIFSAHKKKALRAKKNLYIYGKKTAPRDLWKPKWPQFSPKFRVKPRVKRP